MTTIEEPFTLQPTVQEALAAPFPEGEVKVRVGAVSKDKQTGLALHYIDARTVMDRLDTVLGVAGWHDAYRVVEPLGGGVECRLSCFIEDLWVTKADVGYPNAATDPDALKGAYSDALKRAAVKFGVGRFLYGIEREWRALNEWGSFKDGAPHMDVDRSTGEIREPSGLVAAARVAVQDQPAMPREAVCQEHKKMAAAPWIAKGGPNKDNLVWHCAGKQPDGSWCRWEWPVGEQTLADDLLFQDPSITLPAVTVSHLKVLDVAIRAAGHTNADLGRLIPSPTPANVQRWMQDHGAQSIESGIAILIGQLAKPQAVRRA